MPRAFAAMHANKEPRDRSRGSRVSASLVGEPANGYFAAILYFDSSMNSPIPDLTPFLASSLR